MLIGICGKSGSGKTTLANKLTSLYPQSYHLNIDNIGHDVINIESVKNELVKAFSDSILTNNIVDRKKLGLIVFKNHEAMLKLTSITWLGMEKEIDKEIANNPNKLIILDWQLLPKTKYYNMCDIKILIKEDYNLRRDRAMERDKITENDFNLRDQASIEYQDSDFDYVISSKEIDSLTKKLSLKEYL